MKIKVERSGGMAGISISKEMDARDLPPALVNTAKKMMEKPNSSSIPLKLTPRGAADHYSYRISIQEGVNQSVIECNQYNIQDDLKPLIRYIERNSKPK